MVQLLTKLWSGVGWSQWRLEGVLQCVRFSRNGLQTQHLTVTFLLEKGEICNLTMVLLAYFERRCESL